MVIVGYILRILKTMTSCEELQFSEQGGCKRFRNAKPDGQKSPGQLIVRIRNFVNKWMEFSEVGKTFAGVEDLMVREQFNNSCPRNVSIFFKALKPRNLRVVGSDGGAVLRRLQYKSCRPRQQWQDRTSKIPSLPRR